MKRKMVLAVALVLTMAFVLELNSVTSVRAQPPQRFRFETGAVKLGPNQILRITVDWGDGAANTCRAPAAPTAFAGLTAQIATPV